MDIEQTTERIKKESLESKTDLMFCTRLSKSALMTYESVYKTKTQWYHWLFDKELKALEQKFAKDFQHHIDMVEKIDVKYRLSESESIPNASAKTCKNILASSCYMHAETGRMLKSHRSHSMIKFALAINIFAVSALVLDLLSGHLF